MEINSMAYRGEFDVPGKPVLTVYGSNMDSMRTWAKQILSRAPASSQVRIYHATEVLAAILDVVAA